MSRSKRDTNLFIVDLLVAIKKIEIYLSDFDDREEFLKSSLHWDATMRQLEIIGEALKNLLDDEKFKKLSPDYFRKVVNFRNVIAHGYFGIDLDEVWDIVTIKLVDLDKDMKKIAKSIDLNKALEYEVDRYKRLSDDIIVKFLESIKNNQENI